jgi:paraquat-inducible protein B
VSQRANPAVVGAFVVGALVLLVAGVLVFGSGALLRERFPVVAFFSGNVRGLQEGSAVEFRGVRVGTVTRIHLVLDADSKELLIPVYMELEPGSLTVAGRAGTAPVGDPGSFLDQMVVQGLRARLDLKSFVTGQLAVGLDMHPGTRAVRVGVVDDIYEMPTVASTLDRVAEVLQELPLQDMASKLIDTLDRVTRLVSDEHLSDGLRDASAAAAETRRLMTDLRGSVGPLVDESRAALREMRESVAGAGSRVVVTLDAYSSLARDAGTRLDALSVKLGRSLDELAGIRASLEARVAPVAESALGSLREARGAFANARGLLAEDSRTRYNLDVTLEELAAAARSLRIMVDYLEQNPDALIKGRGR